MKTARPPTAPEVLDTYFLELRARLLEIAATLDRIARAEGGTAAVANDPRLPFITAALAILQSDAPNKAEQIQTLYSKP
jgi:hypothetical protein